MSLCPLISGCKKREQPCWLSSWLRMRLLCPFSAVHWDKPATLPCCVCGFSSRQSVHSLACLTHHTHLDSGPVPSDPLVLRSGPGQSKTPRSILVLEKPEPFLMASKPHEWGTSSCVEVGVVLLTRHRTSNEAFLSLIFFI